VLGVLLVDRAAMGLGVVLGGFAGMRVMGGLLVVLPENTRGVAAVRRALLAGFSHAKSASTVAVR
jgi:hypothetical protein